MTNQRWARFTIYFGHGAMPTCVRGSTEYIPVGMRGRNYLYRLDFVEETMKGDFTRDTFDRAKHFSSVRMQQGRVQLDADWNEQEAILHHYLRTLTADLIGAHAGPAGGECGFLITPGREDMIISAGRYYVDGILCENERDCPYSNQPDYAPLEQEAYAVLKKSVAGTKWLAYLDVWERHVSYIEDDRIREVALGGPDTATRAKVVWQVKTIAIQPPLPTEERNKREMEQEIARTYFADIRYQLAQAARRDAVRGDQAIAVLHVKLRDVAAKLRAVRLRIGDPSASACDAPLFGLDGLSDAGLRARVKPNDVMPDPGITSPDSKYLGAENHLYRVEIHRAVSSGGVTTEWSFKWSRDNGSIASAAHVFGNQISVQYARGFEAGQWVELCDDTQELRSEPGTLVRLTRVEKIR
jgi:hypothetical protein